MLKFASLQVSLHYILKSHFPLFADSEGSTWIFLSLGGLALFIFYFSWGYENFLLITYSGFQERVGQVSQACSKWIENWERSCLVVLILVIGWGCLWKWAFPCMGGGACVIWTSHPRQDRWLSFSQTVLPDFSVLFFFPIDPSFVSWSFCCWPFKYRASSSFSFSSSFSSFFFFFFFIITLI